MKFDELRSIGHNIAASLASGIGLPVGVISNIFEESLASSKGIHVNFLTGQVAGSIEPSLIAAANAYRDFLPTLCEKHGASINEFLELSAHYLNDMHGPRFAVTIKTSAGRSATNEYLGYNDARVRRLDSRGRVRRS